PDGIGAYDLLKECREYTEILDITGRMHFDDRSQGQSSAGSMIAGPVDMSAKLGLFDHLSKGVNFILCVSLALNVLRVHGEKPYYDWIGELGPDCSPAWRRQNELLIQIFKKDLS